DVSIVGLFGTAVLVAVMVLLAQLFSGIAASRVGWVPVFGGGLALLAVLHRLGVGPSAGLIVLALFFAAGPIFAEVASQLKAAVTLGRAALRGQQIVAALVGLAAALAVVGASYSPLFERGLVPPPAIGLVTAVALEQQAEGLTSLAPWIVAGALVQW